MPAPVLAIRAAEACANNASVITKAKRLFFIYLGSLVDQLYRSPIWTVIGFSWLLLGLFYVKSSFMVCLAFAVWFAAAMPPAVKVFRTFEAQHNNKK